MDLRQPDLHEKTTPTPPDNLKIKFRRTSSSTYAQTNGDSEIFENSGLNNPQQSSLSLSQDWQQPPERHAAAHKTNELRVTLSLKSSQRDQEFSKQKKSKRKDREKKRHVDGSSGLVVAAVSDAVSDVHKPSQSRAEQPGELPKLKFARQGASFTVKMASKETKSPVQASELPSDADGQTTSAPTSARKRPHGCRNVPTRQSSLQHHSIGTTGRQEKRPIRSNFSSSLPNGAYHPYPMPTNVESHNLHVQREGATKMKKKRPHGCRNVPPRSVDRVKLAPAAPDNDDSLTLPSEPSHHSSSQQLGQSTDIASVSEAKPSDPFWPGDIGQDTGVPSELDRRPHSPLRLKLRRQKSDTVSVDHNATSKVMRTESVNAPTDAVESSADASRIHGAGVSKTDAADASETDAADAPHDSESFAPTMSTHQRQQMKLSFVDRLSQLSQVLGVEPSNRPLEELPIAIPSLNRKRKRARTPRGKKVTKVIKLASKPEDTAANPTVAPRTANQRLTRKRNAMAQPQRQQSNRLVLRSRKLVQQNSKTESHAVISGKLPAAGKGKKAAPRRPLTLKLQKSLPSGGGEVSYSTITQSQTASSTSSKAPRVRISALSHPVFDFEARFCATYGFEGDHCTKMSVKGAKIIEPSEHPAQIAVPSRPPRKRYESSDLVESKPKVPSDTDEPVVRDSKTQASRNSTRAAPMIDTQWSHSSTDTAMKMCSVRISPLKIVISGSQLKIAQEKKPSRTSRLRTLRSDRRINGIIEDHSLMLKRFLSMPEVEQVEPRKRQCLDILEVSQSSELSYCELADNDWQVSYDDALFTAAWMSDCTGGSHGDIDLVGVGESPDVSECDSEDLLVPAWNTRCHCVDCSVERDVVSKGLTITDRCLWRMAPDAGESLECWKEFVSSWRGDDIGISDYDGATFDCLLQKVSESPPNISCQFHAHSEAEMTELEVGLMHTDSLTPVPVSYAVTDTDPANYETAIVQERIVQRGIPQECIIQECTSVVMEIPPTLVANARSSSVTTTLLDCSKQHSTLCHTAVCHLEVAEHRVSTLEERCRDNQPTKPAIQLVDFELASGTSEAVPSRVHTQILRLPQLKHCTNMAASVTQAPMVYQAHRPPQTALASKVTALPLYPVQYDQPLDLSLKPEHFDHCPDSAIDLSQRSQNRRSRSSQCTSPQPEILNLTIPGSARVPLEFSYAQVEF